jgi:hypothetical protein
MQNAPIGKRLKVLEASLLRCKHVGLETGAESEGVQTGRRVSKKGVGGGGAIRKSGGMANLRWKALLRTNWIISCESTIEYA